MRHDWILEVLADLGTYAQKNAMDVLAAKVEEAILVAREEIARVQGDEPLH